MQMPIKLQSHVSKLSSHVTEPKKKQLTRKLSSQKSFNMAQDSFVNRVLTELFTSEPEEKDTDDKCKVNCNSLLYKILYSQRLKSRDIILEIASYCDQFSLQNFFISQDEVGQVLKNPSPQVVKAFDNILIETPFTKQIITLDIAQDSRLISFWDKTFKL